MLGAGAARAGDLLPQRLPGAEDPHPRVARRYAGLLGVLLHGRVLEIDTLQRLGVLGLERAGESADTPADGVAKLWLLVHSRELGGHRNELAIARGAAARVIDDRVAENAIEPADGRLPDLTGVLEAAHQRVLHDLLGERAIVHPALHVREKLAVASDEHLEDLGSRRARHRVHRSSLRGY